MIRILTVQVSSCAFRPTCDLCGWSGPAFDYEFEAHELGMQHKCGEA